MDEPREEARETARAGQIGGLIIDTQFENCRCVRTANGVLVFEFWLSERPARSWRVEARPYMEFLRGLIDKPQDETSVLLGGEPPWMRDAYTRLEQDKPREEKP